MGGRFKREGIYEYMYLIHWAVQQKLIQHCKAIRLQLKNFKNFRGFWKDHESASCSVMSNSATPWTV